MSVFESYDLSKYYGRTTGIANLTMTVEEGDAWAVLGSQMSGKSTLLRLICGLVFPTSGSFELFDATRHRDNPTIKRMIGFAPSHPCIDGKLSVQKYLLQSAKMYGVSKKKSEIVDNIGELCKWFEIDQTAKVKRLHFAAKKKTDIIAAVLHSPKLLLLDEPMLGMDIFEREKIFALLRKLNSMGTAIIYTTRNISDVKSFSTHTALLSDGIFLGSGETAAMSVLRTMRVTVSAGEDNAQLARELGIQNYTSSSGGISFAFAGNTDSLVKLLSKYEIKSLTINEPSTESILASAAAMRGVAV